MNTLHIFVTWRLVGKCRIKRKEKLKNAHQDFLFHLVNVDFFLKKKLENVGYGSEPGHKHKELCFTARQLSAAKSSLTQLRSKLSVYADINCDIKMARLQVQNLKDELVLLEREIADNISNINSS
jgi:hypothetical protein